MWPTDGFENKDDKIKVVKFKYIYIPACIIKGMDLNEDRLK